MSPVGPAWLLPLATTPASDGFDPAWVPTWIPGWLPALVASLGVFVLAWLVARLIVRLVGRRLARRFQRPSLTRTALSGIRAAVFVVALLVALRLNGLDLGNIALSVTVFSAVVGVILAPIVGSVISGVFLLADQPYEIGDMIELDEAGRRGFVEDITLRYTKIFTLDNTFLVIPNGTIRERDVFNYSAEDPRTRVSLEVLVTYESDVPEAQRLIEEAARQVDGVIDGGPSIRIGSARYPAAPDCLISEFADHGVLLTMRYWVTEPYRLQTVRSAVHEQVYAALRASDVEFAYPHSHLVFDETTGELGLSVRNRSGRHIRGSSRTGDSPRSTIRRPDEQPDYPHRTDRDDDTRPK